MTDREEGGIEARSYRVRGRVQGVGFRWWTRSTAERLGVSGSVRNLPDGTVAVRAYGPREALDMLEDMLRAGPRAARVDGVDPGPAEAWIGPLPPDFRIDG